jgi:uncharacterized protein (DUF2141 family)
MNSRLKNKFKTANPICVLLYCCFFFLLASCAQIVAPNGGKKDVIPPKVVKYVPDSASVNFGAKSIAIFFDEFIQLKDLNNQLIISPPLKNIPDIKVKNKALTINFDKSEQFQPNTTYSINFGNAIQDLHENNPVENFKYIFSTGSFIDSLTVKGKVQTAFDHKTEKGVLVMLYSDYSDSVIYKRTPDYFAKTKDDGTFQINNIRNGKYKLLVLKDANNNYKYDSESENVGFIGDLVDVSDNKKILIEVFQQPAKKLFLKKHMYNTYGNILFVFNKTADSIQIKPLNYTFDDKNVLLNYSKNKDTLNYWFRNINKDSLVLQIKNGNKILDTISLKLIKKEEAAKNKRAPFKLLLLSSPGANQNFDLNSEFKFVFNHPLDPEVFSTSSAQTSIKLKEDSVLYKKDKNLFYKLQSNNVIAINERPDSDKKTTAPSSAQKGSDGIDFKEATGYHLFIPPGTFTDFFGLTNDTIKVDFKTREEKFYGTLKLKIDISEAKGNYIVQLLDDKENVVRVSTIKKGETINYSYLYPQKYFLKIIYDDNSNNKWDTGNLLKKVQPEKVIYNSEPLEIRSNWDSEVEWKIAP